MIDITGELEPLTRLLAQAYTRCGKEGEEETEGETEALLRIEERLEEAHKRLDSAGHWRRYFVSRHDGHAVPGLGNITETDKLNGIITTTRGAIKWESIGGMATGKPSIIETLPDNSIGAAALKVSLTRPSDDANWRNSCCCALDTSAGSIRMIINIADGGYEGDRGAFVFSPNSQWKWLKAYSKALDYAKQLWGNYATNLLQHVRAECDAGRQAVINIAPRGFIKVP